MKYILICSCKSCPSTTCKLKRPENGINENCPLEDYISLPAELGRKGGAARSERKTQAARENGRKGGRPRKEKP